MRVDFSIGSGGGDWRGCVSLWHVWSTQGSLSGQGYHMVDPPFLLSRHDEHGWRACVHPRCTCHDHFARVRKAQQASSTPRLQSRKEWTFPPRMHVTCAMRYMHAHVACMSVICSSCACARRSEHFTNKLLVMYACTKASKGSEHPSCMRCVCVPSPPRHSASSFLDACSSFPFFFFCGAHATRMCGATDSSDSRLSATKLKTSRVKPPTSIAQCTHNPLSHAPSFFFMLHCHKQSYPLGGEKKER